MVILSTVGKKSKGWDPEKPYHVIIVYGLSEIYFQQYYVCTFVRYIKNILSSVIIFTNADTKICIKYGYTNACVSTWIRLINIFENHQRLCNEFVVYLFQSSQVFIVLYTHLIGPHHWLLFEELFHIHWLKKAII